MDDGLLEKRRGLGMFVREGARARALERERERFLAREWPKIRARIDALELSLEDLIEGKQP